MERNGLIHSLIDTERAAPFTDILPIGNESRIFIVFIEDRLKNGIPVTVHRAGRNRRAIRLERKTGFFLHFLPAAVLFLGAEDIRFSLCHFFHLLV